MVLVYVKGRMVRSADCSPPSLPFSPKKHRLPSSEREGWAGEEGWSTNWEINHPMLLLMPHSAWAVFVSKSSHILCLCHRYIHYRISFSNLNQQLTWFDGVIWKALITNLIWQFYVSITTQVLNSKMIMLSEYNKNEGKYNFLGMFLCVGVLGTIYQSCNKNRTKTSGKLLQLDFLSAVETRKLIMFEWYTHTPLENSLMKYVYNIYVLYLILVVKCWRHMFMLDIGREHSHKLLVLQTCPTRLILNMVRNKH